jgi:RNA polymerase-binding transcription factor DksA
MDNKLIGYFKKQLLSLKSVISAQINKLRKPVDMGDDIDSFEEEADEATEMAAQAGMVETLKRRAHRVDDALQKMEQGKYGFCEKCKKEIEVELLKVDPESRYCKACKAAMR